MKTFAQFLLDRGAVHPDDLLRSIDYRRWLLPFLGTLAVQRGFLDAAQVIQVVETCELERRHFGQVAVEKGHLRAEQVDILLSEQAAAQLPLGQCLVRLGILTRAHADELEREYREAMAAARSPAPS